MLRLSSLPDIVTVVAWEERARGGRYYTRSRREDGRVVREYVGTGEVAELFARADATVRLERERRAAGEREELERLEDLAAPVAELCELAEAITRAHLIASGHHKHKGEWRRGRIPDAG